MLCVKLYTCHALVLTKKFDLRVQVYPVRRKAVWKQAHNLEKGENLHLGFSTFYINFVLQASQDTLITVMATLMFQGQFCCQGHSCIFCLQLMF